GVAGIGSRLEQPVARARNADEALARVAWVPRRVDESGAREHRDVLRNGLLADVFRCRQRGRRRRSAIAQALEDREVRNRQLLRPIGPGLAQAVAQALDDDGETESQRIGGAGHGHAAKYKYARNLYKLLVYSGQAVRTTRARTDPTACANGVRFLPGRAPACRTEPSHGGRYTSRPCGAHPPS